MNRSSHRRCSVREGVLRTFAKCTGKHLYQSLFSNKVAGLRLATLLKKRLWYRCFPVHFTKFLRTSFLQNTSGGLLLNEHQSKKFKLLQPYILNTCKAVVRRCSSKQVFKNFANFTGKRFRQTTLFQIKYQLLKQVIRIIDKYEIYYKT